MVSGESNKFYFVEKLEFGPAICLLSPICNIICSIHRKGAFVSIQWVKEELNFKSEYRNDKRFHLQKKRSLLIGYFNQNEAQI